MEETQGEEEEEEEEERRKRRGGGEEEEGRLSCECEPILMKTEKAEGDGGERRATRITVYLWSRLVLGGRG